MAALVITHIESEDPGHLKRWLPEGGLDLRVYEPWKGEQLPTSLDGYQALVVMEKTAREMKQTVLEPVHFVPLKSGIA